MAKTFPRTSAGRSISHVGKSRPWLREPNKTKCIDEQSPSVHSYQKSINDRGGWDGKNKTKRNGEFVLTGGHSPRTSSSSSHGLTLEQRQS